MFKGLIDTTLRDGQQSPLLFDSYKYQFSLEEKKKIVNALINVGVRYIEFFSPVVSETERNDFIEIKKYIGTITHKKIMLLAHCRCNVGDIESAVELGFDGVNLYMNGTKNARKYSYRKSFAELKKHIKQTVKQCRKKYPDLYIRFSIEDAFRTTKKDMYAVFDQIAGLVDTFGIPDTVGMATPEMVSEVVSSLKSRYPHVDLECHFHNDRGFALINTVTAIENGVSFADTSIWGLAERSGITSCTGLLFNLYQTNKKYIKGYNIKLCYPLNVLMGSILRLHVPYTEPVSITNRTHIAGVHHKAVMNMPHIYEAHELGRFGVSRNQLLLGPLSGWNLIQYYLREFEYYDISADQAKQISKVFKDKAKKISKRFKPELLLKEIINDYDMPRLSVREEFFESRVENF